MSESVILVLMEMWGYSLNKREPLCAPGYDRREINVFVGNLPSCFHGTFLIALAKSHAKSSLGRKMNFYSNELLLHIHCETSPVDELENFNRLSQF